MASIYKGLFSLLLLCFSTCSAQDELKRPTFPDVFQVEIQGVFLDQLVEVAGSIYYDRTNNRAGLFYTYKGEYTRTIYDFNDNQIISIQGGECTVTAIDDDTSESFFPFAVDDNNKKILAKPEAVLYFTESELDRQEIFLFPTYVYTAVLDFPQYGRKNCDVMHVFSNPQVELPDCSNHACKATLVAISIKCSNSTEQEEIDHTYNFFRFQSSISDPSVFQPPVGVYCDVSNHKVFPGFPEYFSFSYDRMEKREFLDSDSGALPSHRKVWYDSKLNIIRTDEYDDNGLLGSNRIFDLYGGVAYTIVSRLATCGTGPITEKLDLGEMTSLPKMFFLKTPSLKDALYIGNREVRGLDYEVWSLSFKDLETDSVVVEEYYFLKIDIQNAVKLQISHVDLYIYERDDDTEFFKVSDVTLLTINNFQSEHKQWAEFDVAPCYEKEQKLGFKLKLEGPPLVKGSPTYRQLLEKMYMKLIIATNVSIIRISELTGNFDGVSISDFTGWILDIASDSKIEQKEPDTKTAYQLLEQAASTGKLTIKWKQDSEDLQYNVTAIEQLNAQKPKVADCFSGGSLAAAGLVLLVVGISFGISGYYVFLKRRKPRRDDKLNLTSLT